MRKGLLLVIFAFIAASLAFAQQWEFWGELATGLRIETYGGGKDWEGPEFQWQPENNNKPDGPWRWKEVGKAPYDPSISMFNWFMGNYFDFSTRYTRANYGFKTSLWLAFFRPEQPIDIWSVYGWVDLFSDQLRLNLGRMLSSKDQAWVAPGVWDADHNYSQGDGLRVEITPFLVPGLNIGFSLFIPDIDNDVWGYFYPKDNPPDGYEGLNPITGSRDTVYRMTTNPSGWMGDTKNSKLVDFLLNTGFGVKYIGEDEKFTIAAGFKLDSKADRLTDSDWGETYFAFALSQLYMAPEGPNPKGHLLTDFPWQGYNAIWEKYYYDGSKDTINLMSGGMQGYVGFDLNMFGPFRFKAGARAYNLGALDEYGWIWLNQELTFTTNKPLATFGLDMHQRMFVMDNEKRAFALLYTDENHTELAEKKPVLFTFIPRWDVIINRNMYAGLHVPIKFWPGIVNYDLTVAPKIGYSFGDSIFGKTLLIDIEYLFNVIVFSKYGNRFTDNYTEAGVAAGPFRDSDPLIRNTVQINFKIVF